MNSYEIGKRVGRMKREARAYNDNPPIIAYFVAAALIWILMQAVKVIV